MGEKVAELYAEIGVETKGLDQGLAKAQGKLTTFSGGLNDAVKGLTGFDLATVGTGAALGALAAGLKYSIEQAAEAEQVMAQTEAVIKSTGGAAGLTAQEIEHMAGALSQQSTFSDDAIQSGENLLLTFTNIGKDVFPKATEAMIDMATAMHTDAAGGAIQLGKALNDPVAGITALTRVGVTFTAAQKSLIKTMADTGDIAGAQKIILAELNKEFGGSGAAAVGTYAGQMAVLKNNTDNLAEAFGKELLPVLTEATKTLNLLITWNGKVTDALAEHEAEVYQTAASYAAYSEEIVRARLASGLYVDITDLAGIRQGKLVAQTDLLTEAMYKAYKSVDATDRVTENHAKTTDALSDSYDRASLALAMGAKATTDYAAAQQRAAASTSAMLEAGLSGVIQSAQADYLAVMAETTPEIGQLTAQIAKYQAAQGATVTVTKDATTSAAEYELATIKAAVAQQKLAEFTGDNREEYLQLVVAADNAEASVVKLGEGFGITKEFTLDYTSKIQQASGDLATLNATQAAAEAQLLKTTEQFVFQKVAAGLDDEATLALAESMGLIDPASAAAAKAAMAVREEFDKDTTKTAEFRDNADDLARAIASLTSKHIEITVETIRTERIQHITDEYLSNTYGSGGVGYTPPGYAGGADFDVPAGFPNDSYYMRAQTGEHVSITPAGESSSGLDAQFIEMLLSRQTDTLARAMRDAIMQAR